MKTIEYDGPEKKIARIIELINQAEWTALRRFLGNYRGEYIATYMLHAVMNHSCRVSMDVVRDELEKLLHGGSTMPELRKPL